MTVMADLRKDTCYEWPACQLAILVSAGRWTSDSRRCNRTVTLDDGDRSERRGPWSVTLNAGYACGIGDESASGVPGPQHRGPRQALRASVHSTKATIIVSSAGCESMDI